MKRVTIQWTDVAKNGLARLPKKVRRGVLDKANELREADDPSTAHKPLTGPLRGYNRICYSRYRAIYKAKEDHLPSGDVLIHVKILFVAVGIRKEGDKEDIYRFAKKLIDMGIIGVQEQNEEGDQGKGK